MFCPLVMSTKSEEKAQQKVCCRTWMRVGHLDIEEWSEMWNLELGWSDLWVLRKCLMKLETGIKQWDEGRKEVGRISVCSTRDEHRKRVIKIQQMVGCRAKDETKGLYFEDQNYRWWSVVTFLAFLVRVACGFPESGCWNWGLWVWRGKLG